MENRAKLRLCLSDPPMVTVAPCLEYVAVCSPAPSPFGTAGSRAAEESHLSSLAQVRVQSHFGPKLT